jgi:hypothetical protein
VRLVATVWCGPDSDECVGEVSLESKSVQFATQVEGFIAAKDCLLIPKCRSHSLIVTADE